MRGFRFSNVLFIIAICFAFQPGTAWGIDFYIEGARKVAPYIDYWDQDVPVIPINVFCYDPYDEAYKDCEYELSLEVKEGSSGPGDPAGHLHETGRPLGELNWKSGGIRTSNTVGRTDFEVVKYDYLIPEVSGEIEFYSLLSSSRYAFYTTLHTYHFTIKYSGALNALTPSGDGSYSLTGSYGTPGVTSEHTQNHNAAPGTIKAVQAFAGDYFDATGVAIGVNDMSLPWGGKFDVFNNWQGAHKLHRVGTSVDISTGVNETILTWIAEENGCDLDEKSSGIHFECPL